MKDQNNTDGSKAIWNDLEAVNKEAKFAESAAVTGFENGFCRQLSSTVYPH